MDLHECISFLKDYGVNTEEAEKEMMIIQSALIHSENELLDYVDTSERNGATMGYGRSVIKMVRAAMVVTHSKSMVDKPPL